MALFKNFKAAPLSSGFLFVGLIGFIASLYFFDKLGPTWGFTAVLFLVMIFLAAFISMTYASPEDLIAEEEHHHRKV
jgi:uncharacterized membrane protein